MLCECVRCFSFFEISAVRFHLFAGIADKIFMLDCLLCARKNRISIIHSLCSRNMPTEHGDRKYYIYYELRPYQGSGNGSTQILVPSSRSSSSRRNAKCKPRSIIPNEKSTNGENNANDRKQTEAVNTFEV